MGQMMFFLPLEMSSFEATSASASGPLLNFHKPPSSDRATEFGAEEQSRGSRAEVVFRPSVRPLWRSQVHSGLSSGGVNGGRKQERKEGREREGGRKELAVAAAAALRAHFCLRFPL